jgi:hypothetical protein
MLEEHKHSLQEVVQSLQREEHVWRDPDQLHAMVAMLERVLGESVPPAQVEAKERRKLTGRDLQEAFLVGHTGMSWDALHINTKIVYETTAQALNVTLGLLPDTEVAYLLECSDTLFYASNQEGLAYRISQQIHPGNIFQVVIIQAGREVGHGRCQMLQDRTLWKEEWEGLAQELALNFNPHQ